MAFQEFFKSPIRIGIIVFLLCLMTAFLQVSLKETKEPVFDALLYLTMAENITEHGVFANPGMKLSTQPGHFFTPLYPAFLSVFSTDNPDIKKTFSCYRQRLGQCDDNPLKQIYFVQSIIAGMSTFAVYLIVLNLSQRQDAALLATIVSIGSNVFTHYANLVAPENLAFLFFMLFMATYTKAIVKPHLILPWIGGGIFIALSALARPSYIYFIYLFPFLYLACSFHKTKLNLKRSLFIMLCISITCFAVLSPWLIRNYLYFGDFSLTGGYASSILVQRLAFNMMTWTEWAVGFVYLLPDFGDDLAGTLFDKEHFTRLTWYDPNGFYLLGNTTFNKETLELAGGLEHHMNYLVSNVLIPDLGKHIAVTFHMLFRGLWVGKYIGFIAILCLPYFLYWARKNNQLLIICLFLLPNVFFLGLHAFVSVNVTRYNEPLILAYAFILTVVFLNLSSKLIPTMISPVGKPPE